MTLVEKIQEGLDWFFFNTFWGITLMCLTAIYGLLAVIIAVCQVLSTIQLL